LADDRQKGSDPVLAEKLKRAGSAAAPSAEYLAEDYAPVASATTVSRKAQRGAFGHNANCAISNVICRQKACVFGA
jgi:hypothetical protein